MHRLVDTREELLKEMSIDIHVVLIYIVQRPQCLPPLMAPNEIQFTALVAYLLRHPEKC